MNSKTSVALAVGVGYLLGRTHKMKLALVLGAAAATGRLNNVPGQLLQRGTKALGSSPELSRISESGGRLLDAGKAAALAAVNSRVESISSDLQQRTEALTGGATGAATGLVGGKEKQEQAGGDGGPRGQKAAEPAGDGGPRSRRASKERAEEPEDEYDEEEYEDEEEEEDEEQEPQDEYDEEQPEQERRRPVRAGQSSGGAAVRRGRRS